MIYNLNPLYYYYTRMIKLIDNNIRRTISKVTNTMYIFLISLYDYYYFVPPKNIDIARQPI